MLVGAALARRLLDRRHERLADAAPLGIAAHRQHFECTLGAWLSSSSRRLAIATPRIASSPAVATSTRRCGAPPRALLQQLGIALPQVLRRAPLRDAERGQPRQSSRMRSASAARAARIW
ncbi:hypothetical protein [Kouleothrix sp.]|uniref:hypothetical protein n=1 Tax=Kouleothrix sp. TaxID=2779161 RepID=UPI00391B2F41